MTARSGLTSSHEVASGNVPVLGQLRCAAAELHLADAGVDTAVPLRAPAHRVQAVVAQPREDERALGDRPREVVAQPVCQTHRKHQGDPAERSQCVSNKGFCLQVLKWYHYSVGMIGSNLQALAL